MVYILNMNNEPLMPTTRGNRVRWLLKNGLATVVNTKPFTIKLLYKTTNETQPLILGIDPGRTNIGLAVVKDNGKCVYSAQVATRNKDIPKLMLTRKQNRMKHRHLKRRCKRQRRAIANQPELKNKIIERILPGCKEPIVCKYIKNKEARFNNRKRKPYVIFSTSSIWRSNADENKLEDDSLNKLSGWLTPTARQLLQTHINLVNKIAKILPITDIVLEINKFAFMELDNPNIKPWEYAKGSLYGLGSVEDAVNEKQNGKCLFCKHNIGHYHHVVPVSKGGSNILSNRVGLCEKHHKLVHTDQKWTDKLASKKAGLNKKYGALSVLNQIIPYLVKVLEELYPEHFYCTTGQETKIFRYKYSIPKDHYLDAYCIALSTIKNPISIDINFQVFNIRQFRRHDRQACHKENLNRKYYLNGKLVATNRHKAMEQKTDSLEEYILNGGNTSKLTVKEHKPIYKDMKRILPGAIMQYEKERFILQSSEGNHNGIPDYYIGTNGTKYRVNKCSLVIKNTGLVYLSKTEFLYKNEDI